MPVEVWEQLNPDVEAAFRAGHLAGYDTAENGPFGVNKAWAAYQAEREGRT
jgi:hypothetical protein